jgi:hypothetical protein
MTPATNFSPFLSVLDDQLVFSVNDNGDMYTITGVVDSCKGSRVENNSANY